MTAALKFIRAPWSLAMRELLADGAWHDRDEVISVGARKVPPGVAYRERERHRRHSNKAGGVPKSKLDEHGAIASGSKRVAYGALRSWVASGSVERDGERYRLARRPPVQGTRTAEELRS